MRSPFVLSIRHFLWLASLLLFLAFLIVCLACLSSVSGIAHLSTEVSTKNLPTLLENQQALIAVERLRRIAEIVNVADDHQTRRQARLQAEAMRMDSSFAEDSEYQHMGVSLVEMIVELASYRDSAQLSKLRMQDLALDYSAALVEMAARVADRETMDEIFMAYRETSIPKAGTEGISAKSIALAERLKMTDAAHTDFIQAECERHAREMEGLAPVCVRQSKLYTDYAHIQDLQNENFTASSRLWTSIDTLLRGMQDIVTSDAEYLATTSLTAIEVASREALRTILFMLLGGALFYLFFHMVLFWFVVRPLRWTGRKLKDLQEGKLHTPAPSIWIAELDDIADLLERFGAHIAELDSHASLMAEDAAERREIMMAVFRVSVDGYDIWCPDGEYYINDELLRLLGLSDVEELKAHWDDVCFTSHENLMELFEEVQEAGFLRRETTLRSLSGELIPFEVTRLPIRRHGQRCTLSYYRDLREQKRIEWELRQARDEARDASRIKSEFLARMSHELRTPMNGILGITQLALTDAPTPSIAVYLNKIKSSAKVLLCLISDILDFSAMDSGRFSLEYSEFSFPRVLETVEDLLRDQAREKHLHCAVETDSRIPEHLFGDAPRLAQALLHLCGNAIKFTSHGMVLLKCVLEEEWDDRVRLSFTITDTGVGMSTEQLAVLFQPFTQVDGSSTRRHDGAGLGLVIVRLLVEKMGGTLEVQTQPNKGTTMRFTAVLHKTDGHGEEQGPVSPGEDSPGPAPDASENGSSPAPSSFESAELTGTRGDPADGADTAPPAPGPLQAGPQEGDAPPRETPPSPFGGARVLLVEDNLVNQEIACALLESFGLTVILAENGADAVAFLENEDVDCVLMDIQMPIMDGHTAARTIREQGREDVREVPIIAMTAYATEDNREHSFVSGMDDFTTKPIDIATVRAKLEHWIAEGRKRRTGQ